MNNQWIRMIPTHADTESSSHSDPSGHRAQSAAAGNGAAPEIPVAVWPVLMGQTMENGGLPFGVIKHGWEIPCKWGFQWEHNP